MTGVDRVEFAYLRTLSARNEPFFAIARTPFGYVLLDRTAAREMARRLGANDIGPLDALGQLAPRRPLAVRQAEADLRRLAKARALPQRLAAMLRKHLPPHTRYLNVGHANLTDRMLSALRGIDAHVAVFVHDVIPLEAPHWQRPNSVAAFSRFLDRTRHHADLVIYNSADTRRRAEAMMGAAPANVVAHLGVELASPDLLPAELSPRAPYFVALGTIEPRKNHALLLDIWEQWGGAAPQLFLAGTRGWENDAVFARLDAGIARVCEVPGLSDGEVTTLLTGSNGLLFPSHLEGYGLPPMEAAALGVPVLCQPLEVLREVMGDVPIYEDASNAYPWRHQIEKLAEQRHKPGVFVPPSWADHFNTVLMLT